jgi:hypothetical protein
MIQSFDINLVRGTNTIVLRCEDLVGRVTTNTLTYELRPDQDNTSPRISIQWPTRGRQVSGAFFTARGQVDDFATGIAGQISGGGRTMPVRGSSNGTGDYGWSTSHSWGGRIY